MFFHSESIPITVKIVKAFYIQIQKNNHGMILEFITVILKSKTKI
jgi:hypothetical protein